MKERLVARLRAEVSGRYLSAAIASRTCLRVDSRTFGSLLTTRETVLRDVFATRATSLMLARFMSVLVSEVSVRAVRGRAQHLLDRNVPPAHFDDRCRDSLRGIARGDGQRFAGPKGDVVVAPQDRERGVAVRGLPDRQVLEQRHSLRRFRHGERDSGDIFVAVAPRRGVRVAGGG